MPAIDGTYLHAGAGLQRGILSRADIQSVKTSLQAAIRVEVTEVDLDGAYIANGKVYVGDDCISAYDLVFWYYRWVNPPQDIHRWDWTVLSALALSTRVLPNPLGHLRGLDKIAAHTLLNRHGVATPTNWAFPSRHVHRHAPLLDSLAAGVIKPPLGNFGTGVHKLETPRQFIDVIQYAEFAAGVPFPAFLEEFEDHDIRKWTSAVIINGKVLFGYRKRAERIVDGWKVYDAEQLGGAADYVDPALVADIASRAAAILEADIIGFDFIYSKRRRGYLIVDENTYPGLYPHCFEKAGSGSLPKLLAAMALERLRLPPLPMTSANPY